MKARFWPTDTVNFGVELYVVWNSSVFLMDRQVLFYGQSTCYTNDITLNAGDTVDCVVGPYFDGGYDTTAVEIQFECTLHGTPAVQLAWDRDKSCLRTGPNLGPDGMPHCSGAGSSPIFTKAGNYRNRADDAVLPARGMPLQITRFYNSVDDYVGPFSHSWAFNYTIQLIRTTDENGNEQAIVRWANGVRKYFLLTNGVYQADVNCFDTLACTTRPAGFVLRMKTGLRLNFDSIGTLTSQEDANGNKVTFTYYDGTPGKKVLQRAQNDDGRWVDYFYDWPKPRVSYIYDWTLRRWDYKYDAKGDLVQVIYPDGNTVGYTYDTNHQVTAILDARKYTTSTLTYSGDSGRATSYNDGSEVSYTMTYSPTNRAAVKTDSLSAAERFEFNEYGNKVSWANPLGDTMQFAWTSNQNVEAVTDALGHQTRYAYDACGNILQVSNALGQVWRYTYETNYHHKTAIVSPAGNVTSNAYDARGNLVWSRDPRGFVTTFGYDAYGNLTNIVDARGNASAMAYDSHGQLISSRDAFGNVQTYAYDNRGNQTAVTDARGFTWSYGYDIMGRMTGVTNPLGQVTLRAYDANGNLTAVTDAAGHTSRLGYDAFDRLAAVTNALGYATRYTYDAYGHQTASHDALGHTVSNAYDAIGRLIAVTDPLGGQTRYEYDANGNRLRVTDALDSVTRYAYDALGRTLAVTNALGAATCYAYDANGNPVVVTDPNGHTKTSGYDARNTVTNAANALGLAYRYQYDGNNNLTARTDPNGATLLYSYDALNRLTGVAFPDGTSIGTSYDANGNVTQLSNAVETVRYAYDPLNRVTNVFVVGMGLSVGYEYDAAGNRSVMVDPSGGRTRYTYDALNRLTSLRDPSDNQWAFDYDVLDRATNSTLPNGIVATYGYDAADRLTSLVYRAPGGAVLQTFEYAHDALGNPLRVKREDNLYEVYQYDRLNQLTRVDYDSATPDGPSADWAGYAYDPAGNRLTLSTAGGTVTYLYDAADRLLTVTSPTASASVEWDNNGNMTRSTANGADTRYFWDAQNRLKRILYADGHESTFDYYADGQRHTAKTGSGLNETRRYLYDGANPLWEKNGVGQLLAKYVYSLGADSVLARQCGGSRDYYLRDGLGSVSALADGEGNLTATYRYDAFGTVRRTTGVSDNNTLFTARTLDSDSGLYYYRARYLDPKLGLFLSADSVGSGHPYGYVNNRPTALTDPSGHLGEIGPSAGFVGGRSLTGLESVPRYASNAEAARAQHYTVFNTMEEMMSGYAPGQKQFKMFCGSVHMPPPPAPKPASKASASTVSKGEGGGLREGDPNQGSGPGGGMGGGGGSAPNGFGGGGGQISKSVADQVKDAIKGSLSSDYTPTPSSYTLGDSDSYNPFSKLGKENGLVLAGVAWGAGEGTTYLSPITRGVVEGTGVAIVQTLGVVPIFGAATSVGVQSLVGTKGLLNPYTAIPALTLFEIYRSSTSEDNVNFHDFSY